MRERGAFEIYLMWLYLNLLLLMVMGLVDKHSDSSQSEVSVAVLFPVVNVAVAAVYKIVVVKTVVAMLSQTGVRAQRRKD
jgi:hypothetical protein